MKKTLASFLVALLIISIDAGAEKIAVQPFSILTPRTTGMGNAYISIAKGFESLWTNPACFDTTKHELNILDFDASGLGGLDAINKLSSESGTSNTGDILRALEPVITGSGAGMNTGFGLSWVGNRIGLGLYDSFNLYMQGDPFPGGVGGYMDNTFSLMGGYAQPFHLTDGITLSTGIALRPSFKWRTEIDSVLIENALQDNFDLNTYLADKMASPAFGLPVDLGTRATFPHGLSAALTVKDLFANYHGGNSGYDYYVPWSLNFGGAWNPDMKSLKWLIDPTISVEVSNFNKVISKETGIWKEFHLGVELVTLKKVVTFWAGLNGGYPAFGTGLDLAFFNLAVAYGTTEYGRYLGDCPVSNLTVEVSIRLD